MTYVITEIDHQPLTELLQSVPIDGDLEIIPPKHGQWRGFRSSGLSACLRTTGYQILGYAETDRVREEKHQLAADMGTVVHRRLQQQAEQIPGLVAKWVGWGDHPVPLIEGTLGEYASADRLDDLLRLKFKGQFDGILEGSIFGADDQIVWDVKTTDARYMFGDYGERWLPKKLAGYCTQIHSYMYFLGLETRAWIYLVNRANTDNRRLYEVPWQPERWALDLQRLEAAVAATDAGELPRPEPERSCKFCSFYTACGYGRK